MPASSDSIVILGLAKTGSTGLYTNVKAALRAAGHDHYCLFEPTRPDQLHNIHKYAPRMPVLTKVMIAREPDLALHYDRFDRRVTLLRDPRDMIVSFLLFRPFIRADVPWERVEPFVDAIRRKESDPSSMSVRALHELADGLGLASYRLERVVEFMEWQEQLIARHQVFTLRYEDLIAGRLRELSDYLGVQVGVGAQGSPWLDHILRSAGSGDWRHWFTPEDVTAYRPFVTRYMKRFEYPDDWTLAEAPQIATATASGYVEGKYRRRRDQQQRRRGGLSDDVASTSQPHRARLEHLADDGNAQALYRLAKATSSTDPERAHHLAYRAAVQGHRPAMRMVSDVYRRGRGVEADEHVAAFWAAEGAGEQQPKTGLRRLLRRR